MKVIEKSLQVLPQSALRIATAMETAADTVLEQGHTFAAEVSSCAASLNADMKTLAEQMGAIPALLDPSAILDCCTEALETAARDLRQLASDAIAIPQRLLAQTAALQQVVDQGVAVARSLSNLLPDLAKLAPDCSVQIAFFNSLPARGQALASLAMRTGALFEQYARDLLPLSAQLRMSAASGADLSPALLAQAQSLQGDSLMQVQTLRQTLDGDTGALESVLAQTTMEVARLIGGVSQLIRQKGMELMAPLQGQIDLLDGAMQTLRNEAEACDALFDESIAQLDRLGDILLKPLAAARAQFDAVNEELASAATGVDAMLRKTLEPLDALALRVDVIKQTIEDVVAIVGEEVVQVQGLLAEMDVEADHASAVLAALPDNFTPVRTQIADAVALLVEIKGRIPGFVIDAGRALDGCSAELDQAELLCNRAIEVCTLYMMKAPPLMLARTLFMGVKASIPGIKVAIAGARLSVQAAGTQATVLMDQAIVLVQLLNPLLEQAMVQLRVAIDTLSALLAQLQMALRQVSDAAGVIPPALVQQVESAGTAMQGVLDQVRSAADECLAQLQCEALVRRLQQGLSDLWDRTFAPLDAQVKQASAPLQMALQQGKDSVAKAAQLAQESLLAVRQTFIGVQEQAQPPVTQLADMVASWHAPIEAAGSAAQQQVKQVVGQALSIVDLAALKIAGLNIGTAEVNHLAAPGAAVLGAAIGEIDVDAQTLNENSESLNRWQSDAVQAHSQASTRIDGAVAQLALAPVQAACERASANLQAANESMPDADPVASQVQTAFADMQQDAQGVIDATSAAQDEMALSLEDACVDAQQVASPYASASEPLLKNLQTQLAEVTRIADKAASAEQAVAAKIAATEHSVGAASQDATVQTVNLKDAAQAGIAKTLTQVGAVQAQVNLARSDVIAAEAIVDKEVVKHGGASAQSAVLAAPAALAAQAMAPDSSAASAGPAAAAGAVASAEAGAAAATPNAASVDAAVPQKKAAPAQKAADDKPAEVADTAQQAQGVENAEQTEAASSTEPAASTAPDAEAPLAVPASSDRLNEVAEPVAESGTESGTESDTEFDTGSGAEFDAESDIESDIESADESVNDTVPEPGIGSAAANDDQPGLNLDFDAVSAMPSGQTEASVEDAASAAADQRLSPGVEVDEMQALTALRGDAIANQEAMKQGAASVQSVAGKAAALAALAADAKALAAAKAELAVLNEADASAQASDLRARIIAAASAQDPPQ